MTSALIRQTKRSPKGDLLRKCRYPPPASRRPQALRGAFEVDIEVGGVRVRNGDIVVGDADGVVVLPREHAAAIIDKADQRVRDEEQIIGALRAGRTTLELYGLGAGLDA